MEPGKRIDMAVLGAVPVEVDALRSTLDGIHSLVLLGQTLWIGSFRDLRLLLGTTGLGKVNAAAVTAALLQRFSVAQVWNIGSAGAYGEGPLATGDVLLTLRAICGDEGILGRDGIAPVSRMGIPIAVRGSRVLFDEIPVEPGEEPGMIRERIPPGWYRLEEGTGARRAVFQPPPREVPESSASTDPVKSVQLETSLSCFREDSESHPPGGLFQVVYGPSVTVGMASGDPETAHERFLLYGAFAENMEGSAVAQTCFLHGVPAVECRGISNMAGDRGRENWRMEEAVAHCHGILLNRLETLREELL